MATQGGKEGGKFNFPLRQAPRVISSCVCSWHESGSVGLLSSFGLLLVLSVCNYKGRGHELERGMKGK